MEQDQSKGMLRIGRLVGGRGLGVGVLIGMFLRPSPSETNHGEHGTSQREYPPVIALGNGKALTIAEWLRKPAFVIVDTSNPSTVTAAPITFFQDYLRPIESHP